MSAMVARFVGVSGRLTQPLRSDRGRVWFGSSSKSCCKPATRELQKVLHKNVKDQATFSSPGCPNGISVTAFRVPSIEYHNDLALGVAFACPALDSSFYLLPVS